MFFGTRKSICDKDDKRTMGAILRGNWRRGMPLQVTVVDSFTRERFEKTDIMRLEKQCRYFQL